MTLLKTEAHALESPPEVPASLLARHLGLPVDAEWMDDVAALVREASDWYFQHGRPWTFRRQVVIASIDRDVVHLDIDLEGASPLTSRFLADLLKGASAHSLVVVAISAGPHVDREIERLWTVGRPDGAMALNAYAAALTEHLRSRAADELSAIAGRLGMAVLPHYSPGYEGWDLSDQRRLHELVTRAECGLPGPLDLLPSGTLKPMKSTLAVFPVTRSSSTDERETTGGRAGELRYTSIVEGASAWTPEGPAEPTRSPPAYAVAESTLARWSSQRLTVSEADDGHLAARFRFEGSTCTNMGLLLAFDYEFRLARDNATYRVLDATCRPAGGDRGHRSMCAYVEGPEQFMSAISEPPPWIGRTLDDLLNWNPETSATACLCTRACRDHKWRLALHTLHYALENDGRPLTGSSAVRASQPGDASS